MVLALKANRQELVENQRELNQAQVRMLQAQLNPHFLCNTLDTMKWISKINHVPQVALMSTNLADILRFCISAEEFVTLSREVEVLNRYVEIQKIRLSDQFSFLVSLPEKRTSLDSKMNSQRPSPEVSGSRGVICIRFMPEPAHFSRASLMKFMSTMKIPTPASSQIIL